MAKEELRSEWEARINEFKSSGQSQASWCKEKSINLRTFNYWYVKFKKPTEQNNNTTNWLSLKVDELGKKVDTSSIRVQIGNAVIEIQPEFDAELLVKIVKTLSLLC